MTYRTSQKGHVAYDPVHGRQFPSLNLVAAVASRCVTLVSTRIVSRSSDVSGYGLGYSKRDHATCQVWWGSVRMWATERDNHLSLRFKFQPARLDATGMSTWRGREKAFPNNGPYLNAVGTIECHPTGTRFAITSRSPPTLFDHV